MEPPELPQEVRHAFTERDWLAYWLVSATRATNMEDRGRALEDRLEREDLLLTRAVEASDSVHRWKHKRAELDNDQRVTPAAMKRTSAQLGLAIGERRQALRPIFAHGLEERVGLPLDVGGEHREVFDWFRYLEVKLPAQISVCSTCSVVFRTARKARAANCPACLKKKKPAFSPVVATERGGWTFEARGIKVQTNECPVCGNQFDTKRSHKEFCTEAHGKFAKRQVKAGKRVRFARGPYWVEIGALELRLSTCVDCEVEYPVQDPPPDPELLRRCARCIDIDAGCYDASRDAWPHEWSGFFRAPL